MPIKKGTVTTPQKSKAAGGRASKPAHRPKGAIALKHAYGRDEFFSGFRCSLGFQKCVDELLTVAGYQSKADIMHEALEILAARKLSSKFYFRDKIQ